MFYGGTGEVPRGYCLTVVLLDDLEMVLISVWILELKYSGTRGAFSPVREL